MSRFTNFQSLSWFVDEYRRGLLDMDPPYQRRSVWNQQYKDYFIDTILNSYPVPAVFLHQQISDAGISKYSVVDGKQRLLTVFQFIDEQFPVGEACTISAYRGQYFNQLPSDVRTEFYKYQICVEYIASSDEEIINNIFDRINRNVAKLTAQELRHARFEGEFIKTVEALVEWISLTLPPAFPQFTSRSRAQMKDSEMVANLLLLIEQGPRSYSQLDLDQAFSDRDEVWEQKYEVEETFRDIVKFIRSMLDTDSGASLVRTRLRNQADFYSLVGALHQCVAQGDLPNAEEVADHLVHAMQVVEDETVRAGNSDAIKYYEAARSASNDAGPRNTRIQIMHSWINNGI